MIEPTDAAQERSPDEEARRREEAMIRADLNTRPRPSKIVAGKGRESKPKAEGTGLAQPARGEGRA